MILTPANVRIRREPKCEIEKAADAAAALLWKRIDSGFDDENDFWATRRAGFMRLFRAARTAKELGGDLAAEGEAVYMELRSCADEDEIDAHSFEALGGGLRKIKRALATGNLPAWLSEATGLKPL